MGKTMYHSELASLGVVDLTVKSDILASKYKGKLPYVVVDIDGQERWLNLENEDCEATFDGQKGASFAVVAEGSRDSATITYVGEKGEDREEEPQERPAPPPRRPQERPAPRNGSRPPPARENAPRTPPKRAATAPGDGLGRARVLAAQCGNLNVLAWKAAKFAAEQALELGDTWSVEHLCNVAMNIAIQLEKEGALSGMPAKPLEAKHEPAPAAQEGGGDV